MPGSAGTGLNGQALRTATSRGGETNIVMVESLAARRERASTTRHFGSGV